MALDLLIVTDLDDTVYDWLGFYIPSFWAMLQEVARISGLPEDELVPAFRRVHQRHGTTEYAFSIEELDVLPPVRTPHDLHERLERFGPAIRAFRESRKDLLRPYPGVRDTLESLVAAKVPIVAYSDSMIEYVSRRLRQLDVDQYFAAIYAPEDHGIPANLPEALLRKKAPEEVRARTDHRAIPEGRRKPDPEILTTIARDLGCPISRTVYVGDSLSRDVRMAQDAGAIDVWARYGAHKAGQDLELLKRITYWKEQHMETAEGAVASPSQSTPGFVIDAFSDLLDIVRMVMHQGMPSTPSI